MCRLVTFEISMQERCNFLASFPGLPVQTKTSKPGNNANNFLHLHKKNWGGGGGWILCKFASPKMHGYINIIL